KSKNDSEQEEVLIKNSTFSRPVESKPSDSPAETKNEPAATQQTSDFSNRKGVKTVGKIDLDNLNQRTKPDKNKPAAEVKEEVKATPERAVEKEPAEAPSAEVAKPAEEIAKAEAPKTKKEEPAAVAEPTKKEEPTPA